MPAAPDDILRGFLITSGLARADQPASWTPLAGGVSSEIWRLDLGSKSVCIKRALAKLRVEADWYAPVARNATEWAWFETVAAIDADLVPKLLAHDPAHGLFAMEFLPAERYPLWKSRLLLGDADVGFARTVGGALVRIHAATAGDMGIAARFATDEAFHALRIEPYLLATAERHADLRARIYAIAERTAAQHRTLVHGDISPKNILMGPNGPVFLDAETAWYGDPAFDLAFCLNHLLLKALVQPDVATDLEASFAEFRAAYLGGVTWEPPADVELRTVSLLPALMLARVDGKSPVEYLDTAGRQLVRDFVRAHLRNDPSSLTEVYPAWRRLLSARP